MKPMAWPTLLRIAPLLLLAVLSACDEPLLAGGSSSTESGKKVNLTGRVSASNGQGLAGVVVTLDGTSLADTTGSDGSYVVAGRVATTQEFPPPALRFTLQGQSLGLRVVARLQDTVLLLQVVQRGFLGALDPAGHVVTRIEGMLTGDGIPPGDSIVATFYHNTVSRNYSGFIYFPLPGDSIRSYAVRVRVYGTNDTLLTTSTIVPFTSQAGNILIPDIHL